MVYYALCLIFDNKKKGKKMQMEYFSLSFTSNMTFGKWRFFFIVVDLKQILVK